MHSHFSDERRLTALKAARDGEIETLKSLLDKDPSLINAKTKTKGSSLLHLAAVGKHINICELLLAKQHETNPVDNDGNTPYQSDTSPEIKKILVANHKKFLCSQFFTVQKENIPSGLTLKECEVMSPTEYSEFLSTRCPEEKDTTFGVTIPKSLSGRKYEIKTIFREDILMTPYIGILLTIHENEQALQVVKIIQKNLELQLADIQSQFHVYEVLSFAKSVDEGIKQFTFLGKYPEKDDRKDISEAKKMFIAFSLMGFASHYMDCSPEQQTELDLMPLVFRCTSLAEKIYSNNNPQKKSICDEMNNKYYLKSPDNNNSQRHKFNS